MSDIKQRLEEGAATLQKLEQRRLDTRTPQCGYDIEFLLVYRELEELEKDILADPGALESQLVRVRRKPLTDGSAADAR